MSHNYDNWEKLVVAVLRREELRALAYCESMDSISSSHGYESSSNRSSFSYSSSIRYHEQSPSSSWLYRQREKKSYMLSARELHIAWKDNPIYWKWTSLPESRFSEVAELKNVCWLDILGIMQSQMLSPNTNYTAYLVFKLTEGHYGLDCSAKARIRFVVNGIPEIEVETSTVYIVPQMHVIDGRVPQTRSDGWMEIELGSFFNGEIDNNIDIYMQLSEVVNRLWKKGLIVEGIEVRPKEEASVLI